MNDMKGTAIKYGEDNINTDLIIPARYLIKSDYDYLSQHCMEDIDPDFNEKRERLNATIMIGGSNFGCGSSREQAPIAIKAAGIQCVIAPSYARIFFRNSINIGLPIIKFNEIQGLSTGDILDINFEEGVLKNETTNTEFKITKMPPFLQNIIAAEGLVNFARKKILNE